MSNRPSQRDGMFVEIRQSYALIFDLAVGRGSRLYSMCYRRLNDTHIPSLRLT